MNLHLHHDQLQLLARQLARAHRLEIGGVLVGEHLSTNVFRIVDLSFQQSTGTETCFVRRPEQHEEFFKSFFQRTGNAFQRFNYLGEWHSHPSFPACPSDVDRRQMQAIVDDERNAPLFAVLLVVRLLSTNDIELSATAFRAGGPSRPVETRVSPRPPHDPTPIRRSWWQRILEPEPRDARMRSVRVDDNLRRFDASAARKPIMRKP